MNFIKNNKKILTCIIIFFIIICLSIFLNYQNNHLEITEYNFSNSKITKELDGYTIINISDLHNKSFGKNNTKLIEMISNEKPDMLVVTGDVVDSGKYDTAISFLKKAVDIAPVYFVTGNHELALNNELYTFQSELEKINVTVLNNKVENINNMFYLFGLDEHELQGDTSSIKATSKTLFESENVSDVALKILLAH